MEIKINYGLYDKKIDDAKVMFDDTTQTEDYLFFEYDESNPESPNVKLVAFGEGIITADETFEQELSKDDLRVLILLLTNLVKQM